MKWNIAVVQTPTDTKFFDFSGINFIFLALSKQLKIFMVGCQTPMKQLFPNIFQRRLHILMKPLFFI